MNVQFTAYDQNGRYIAGMDMPDVESTILNTPPRALVMPGMFNEDTYLLNGTVETIPPRPAPFMIWTGQAWEDLRTPADMQAALYEARAVAGRDKIELLTDLLISGKITQEEYDIAAEGRIPHRFEPGLESLPSIAQSIARAKWRNDVWISRMHPVIVLSAIPLLINDDEMDVFFGVHIPS